MTSQMAVILCRSDILRRTRPLMQQPLHLALADGIWTLATILDATSPLLIDSVCPGQHLAKSSIFLTVSSLLAVFDIMKPLDASGKEVEIEARFTRGLVS